MFVCLSSLFYADIVLSEQGTTIQNGWVRLVPPVSSMTAAYMVIRNDSDKGDRLLSATSDVSERVELHTTVLSDDGMMRMRQMDSIAIPANGEVELKPGAMHLMLIGLTTPLVKGNRVVFNLVFEHQGSVTVELEISGAARAFSASPAH
ncbi:MAG: hypothetical protein CSB48_13765 [Proteobacteria bacterium]|nr:MAG: hypothetical protein CSB48_13765 [Pseudomonadota bacterium]